MPAKAGIQYATHVQCDGLCQFERAPDTGSPACAGDDKRGVYHHARAKWFSTFISAATQSLASCSP
jgi:hypothetical protein